MAQFLQIKEGLAISSGEYYDKFFVGAGILKVWDKCVGLTGTLGNEETKKFFREYNTDVVVIPPYKMRPVVGNENSKYICKELPTIVCSNREEWIEKIVSTNIFHAKCGQGVLIICMTISEVLEIVRTIKNRYRGDKVFTYTGQVKFEKDRIENGEIIVATNIAGRGTDITTSEEIEDSGGMHVCVTFVPGEPKGRASKCE